MDITHCRARGCLLSEKCKRAKPISDEPTLYFTDEPFKVIDGKFTCDMFWGEKAESILNQLNEIMNGNEELEQGNSADANEKGTI